MEIADNVWLGLIAVLTYLIGSFPSAYFVTRAMTGKDIRFEGSSNVGGMNAFGIIRDTHSGKRAALGLSIIQAADMGKGILAIFLARWLVSLDYHPLAGLIIASVFVLLGHIYPFYFKFKAGGIGLASFMGVLLALNPPLLPIWGGVIILAITVAHYAQRKKANWKSLSSLFLILGQQRVGRLAGMAVALIPLYFYDPSLFFPVLAATAVILIKHAERIKVPLRKPQQDHG
jgi:glycerol-3-phosphate acyltransferase PlsY